MLREQMEMKKAKCNNVENKIINSQESTSSFQVMDLNINIKETYREKKQNYKLHTEERIKDIEESEELIIEEIEFDEIQTEEIEIDRIKTEETEIDRMKTKEIEIDGIKIEKIKIDEINTKKTKIDEIKTKEIEIDKIKTEEIETEQIKIEEMPIEEIKTEEMHMEDTYIFNDIEDNNLVIDNESYRNLSNRRCGRCMPKSRSIIDFSFMWDEIHRTFDNHAKQMYCHFKDWKLVNSRHCGLRTQLFFKCEMCHHEASVWSESTESKNLDINTAMVSAAVKLGINYFQLKKLCTAMNIQCMSNETFMTYEKEIN